MSTDAGSTSHVYRAVPHRDAHAVVGPDGQILAWNLTPDFAEYLADQLNTSIRIPPFAQDPSGSGPDPDRTASFYIPPYFPLHPTLVRAAPPVEEAQGWREYYQHWIRDPALYVLDDPEGRVGQALLKLALCVFVAVVVAQLIILRGG